MSTFGIGLVSYKMTISEIRDLSDSIVFGNPIYKVVVDNSPNSDLKIEFEKYGWEYLHNPINQGFGASHNIIFSKYSHMATYHLIVNPDIVFEGEVIGELVKFLDKNYDAGCVMPKIYYFNGRLQKLAKLLPGPFDLLIRRLPINFLKNKVNSHLELEVDNLKQNFFRVPFVSGCFLLFRSSVIAEIGFFDQRFFMYMEDLDLSRRLWESKFYPYYYGSVVVKHGYKKGSSINIRLFIIHIVSFIKYFNKWGWFDRRRKLINIDFFTQFNQ
jgi:GT2 family glycosyltransferase